MSVSVHWFTRRFARNVACNFLKAGVAALGSVKKPEGPAFKLCMYPTDEQEDDDEEE